MPTYTTDSGLSVLLRDAAGSGFYAERFPGTNPLGPAWELLRYDGDWRIAASRSAAELVDTVSLSTPPYLQFTPDHRYVILAVNALQSSQMLIVLDALTLGVVNRTGRSVPRFPVSAPTAAMGSQVLLAWVQGGGCPAPLVWLDVVTGLTADSTAMPCDYLLQGALTSRQVYRRGPTSGPMPRSELYDITTGSVIATADSVVPVYQPWALATQGRLVYFEAGDAAVLDGQALTLVGRVATGTNPADPRTVTAAVVDATTGAVIGTSAGRALCSACLPTPDGLVAIDPRSLGVIIDQVLGLPVEIVQ